jgi:rod shape-determining protein MreD
MKKNDYLLIFLGIFSLLLQTTTFVKYISIFNFTPDFVAIFVILFTLSNNFKKSIYFAVFLGLLQDFLTPSIFIFNTISKVILSLITYSVKKQFYFSDMWYKSILIIGLSMVDIALKTVLIFLKTGIFYFSQNYIIYIILNFAIFYLFAMNNKFFNKEQLS